MGSSISRTGFHSGAPGSAVMSAAALSWQPELVQPARRAGEESIG